MECRHQQTRINSMKNHHHVIPKYFVKENEPFKINSAQGEEGEGKLVFLATLKLFIEKIE